MSVFFTDSGILSWMRVENYFHCELPKFERVHSPNFSKFLEPRYIVVHYTAGGSAAGTVDWFMNPDSKVSAHFVIERTGDLTQCVSCNDIAWHCGKSEYKGQQNLNPCSIGIELANWGPLRRDVDSGMFYPVHQWYCKKPLYPEQVIYAVPGTKDCVYYHWERFPAEQLFSLALLTHCICRSYGITELLSHGEIAPGRKVDPGPAFPLDIFKRFCKLSGTLQ